MQRLESLGGGEPIAEISPARRGANVLQAACFEPSDNFFKRRINLDEQIYIAVILVTRPQHTKQRIRPSGGCFIGKYMQFRL